MSREYKVGDKFRVMRKTGNIQHCFETGQVVSYNELRLSGDRARFTDADGVTQTVMFSDLEFLDTPKWEMEFPMTKVEIFVPHGMVIEKVVFAREDKHDEC